MEADTKYMVAEVYHLDEIGGVNGTWVWDLGVFTLVGTEDYPVEQPTSMDFFSSAANNVDVDFMNERVPDRTEELSVYLGDYCTYVETSFSSMTHALSEENEPYKVMTKDVDVGGDSVVTLEESNIRAQNKTIGVEKSVFENLWTPVIKL